MNTFYPINVNLAQRLCVVIGGGNVAARKVRSLLDFGALVKVISSRLIQDLARLAQEGAIQYVAREYQPGDLEGAFLVVCATNDERLNREIAGACAARNLLVNVVDDPGRCSFVFPAVVKRGSLTISVSTGGKSPLLARKIRERLEKEFGPQYGDYVEFMADLRKEIMARIPDPRKRWHVYKSLLEIDLLDLMEKEEQSLIKERIARCISSSSV